MGDHPTALALYGSIVTALLKRERTGEGSHVHTSLLANGMWSASCIAQAAFANADFSNYRAARGNLFIRVMYETEDAQWLQFTMVRTAEQLDLLFTVLELPHLMADERFSTLEARQMHGSELIELVRPVIKARVAADWMEAFAAVGVPAALAGDVGRLPEDEQVAVNGMAVETDNPDMPRVIKHPLNVEGLARRQVAPAPDAGQHTDQVLQSLGLSDAEISDLRARGVV